MAQRSVARTGWYLVAALLLSCPAVSAQLTFEPGQILKPLAVSFNAQCAERLRPGQKTDGPLEAKPIDELNKRFHSGDRDSVQRAAQYLLDHARCTAGAAGFPDNILESFDHTSQYLWLTWIGPDAFETPVLHRLLVRAPTSKTQKLDLPGITTFYEIFLGRSPSSALVTVMTSTELPDPTVAQIPAVAEKVAPAVFGVIAGVTGKVQAQERGAAKEVSPMAGPSRTPGIPFWVTSFRIVLPHKRAAIIGKSVAKDPVPVAAFGAAADKFRLKNGFQANTCAQKLLDSDIAALSAAQPACGDRKACLEAFDKILRANLTAATAACASDDDKKGLAAIDGTVRSFVIANIEGETTADLAFANARLRRFSFGLVEAIALGLKVRDPRVKLDDGGNLKSDPMPRIMSMVTLNASFRPYDPTLVSPSEAEKWRGFAGAILAPDFGMTAGLSYLPVRHFSLNVGVAGLIVKSVAAEAIGKAPSSPTDPFRIGTAWSWYVGAGYAFK